MNDRFHADSAYDPNNLLDALKNILRLKNDAELSRTLEIGPPVISKIRHNRMPVSAALLIRMHEATNMSVAEMQGIMGDRRAKFRLSSAQGRPKDQGLAGFLSQPACATSRPSA